MCRGLRSGLLPGVELIVSVVDVLGGALDARGVVVAVHGDQPLRQLPEQLDLVLILVHLRVERLRIDTSHMRVIFVGPYWGSEKQRQMS